MSFVQLAILKNVYSTWPNKLFYIIVTITLLNIIPAFLLTS